MPRSSAPAPAPAPADAASHADLLLHPLRLRVVQGLLGGQVLTPKEMLDRLPGVAPATLYRHLRLLTQAGVTVVAGERAVRGVMEKSYALGAAAVAPTPQEFLEAGPDQQFRYFATFVSSLMSQYGAYLSQGNFDLVKEGVGYRQAAFYATDSEYKEFLEGLAALMQRVVTRPPSGRRRRLASFILMPDAAVDTKLKSQQ